MICPKPYQLDGGRAGSRSQVISVWLWVITCCLKRQVSPSPCFYLAEVKKKCTFSRADWYTRLESLKLSCGETLWWNCLSAVPCAVSYAGAGAGAGTRGAVQSQAGCRGQGQEGAGSEDHERADSLPVNLVCWVKGPRVVSCSKADASVLGGVEILLECSSTLSLQQGVQRSCFNKEMMGPMGAPRAC